MVCFEVGVYKCDSDLFSSGDVLPCIVDLVLSLCNAG